MSNGDKSSQGNKSISFKLILKALAAVIFLGAFIYWGLDQEFICKTFQDNAIACDLDNASHFSSAFDIFTNLFRIILVLLLMSVLVRWVLNTKKIK